MHQSLLLVSMLFLVIVVGAQAQTNSRLLPLPAFDFEGHRGARGLLPENTIPSFLKALELGVTTLEMDVVITKDRQVVLSHEPYLSSEICSKPDGAPVSPSEEKAFNIYQMTYAELSRYDCGNRGNARFPEQKPMPAKKPLLRDVIRAVENARAQKGLPPVFYNIETKSTPEGDDVFHPRPDEFARLVYEEVKRNGALNRAIFQSFDERELEAFRKIDRDVYLCLLVDNQDGLEKNLARLSFTPQIYSPFYKLVTPELIQAARRRGMKVVVWTVNSLDEMKALKAMGVDGVITDYPNLREALLAE
ncbi:MAG: glycerophosphodiester phosphodiesterase family protein [Chloroherpetonaceae bacterium]|nr:glycerophosphodiester phosphodiesterase family protein [Chloroherpetonaceae bacterium]